MGTVLILVVLMGLGSLERRIERGWTTVDVLLRVGDEPGAVVEAQKTIEALGPRTTLGRVSGSRNREPGKKGVGGWRFKSRLPYRMPPNKTLEPMGPNVAGVPLTCPTCAAPLTFIAFLTDPQPIAQILALIGEPTSPPRLHPARGPPQAELAFEPGAPDADEVAQESPPDDLDQTPDHDPTEPDPIPEDDFD